ncbi:hypothetical protein J3L16_00480 [Alteromonas sp. 5E99-2]|uniref:hypothetical protein n=1 Tax=Alteromonas sp. 5E99-2 TaxID=2817683 RepID=UPI001A98C1D5|nr:hypothetical protein [Alteromonas sp. 5E99-2]MBO1254153.1 hypothetical protein [Alteromonas sp. 5E99-2]
MLLNVKVSKAFLILILSCLFSACNSTHYYSAEVSTSSEVKKTVQLEKAKDSNQIHLDGVTYKLTGTYFSAFGERCGSGHSIASTDTITPVTLCANLQTGVWRVIPSVLTKFGT